MYDIFINFLVSLSASFAFYYFIENRKNQKTRPPDDTYSSYSITVLKKQFYICFIGLTALVLFKLIPTADSFLRLATVITICFLLVLILFAFMCLLEVVNYLRKEISKYDPQHNRNNPHEN